jgi:pimeloyl-ACP methyl ester carboxylesterase
MMKRQRWSLTGLVLMLLVLAAVPGCAPVKVRQTTLQHTYTAAVQADVISTGELSQLTQQVLRMAGLQLPDAEPGGVFQDLERQYRTDPDRNMQVALVELALWYALQEEARQPEVAADWYLLAAARSYEFLFAAAPGDAGLFDLRYERLRTFYVRAVAGFVQQLQRRGDRWAEHQRTVVGESYRVAVASGFGLFDPNTFDELLFAAEMTFEGLTNRQRRFGIGIGLVGFRKNTLTQPADRFFPRAGTTYAVTALLLFDAPGPGEPGQRPARLCFYDAMQMEALDIGGVRVPLAADFTAALGVLISRTQMKSIALAQTFSGEEWLDQAGFYMTEPFDPQKIPLITVHGLLSSPITWINMQNDLMGDAELRQRYQIWHFMYPPGLPIAVSARLFRDKLAELYQFFDPQRQYSALSNAVVIAHSMGGLLSRTIVSDSGDHLWQHFFRKTPDDLTLSTEAKKQLDHALRFQRQPFITRIIFVAVPHRGSTLAESWAGKLGRMLTTVPPEFTTSMHLMLEQSGQYLDPETKKYLLEEDPSSIRGLSPNNPLFKALADIAVDRRVPFHSIIGDRGLGDGEQGSDGVVPYKSAHMEGAESELIVPAHHSAHTHPLAVREIKRILKLHLHQSGVPRA